MKNNENIDEIIKKALTDYVDADTKEETADVKYSKEHEARMKKMFEDMTKDTKTKKADREIVIRIKFDLITKVAIILIVITVASFALSSGIKAWKENNKLEMYGDNEEYSWLLSENTSELYEHKTSKEEEEYVKAIFEGISGEITKVKVENSSKSQKISFYVRNEEIIFKIRSDVKNGINTENAQVKILESDGANIYFYEDNGQVSYRWQRQELFYTLYGKLEPEEVVNIIKNMNYEKIETNF